METTTLIITDVTRMKTPRVCVAGVTEEGRTIRPVFPMEISKKTGYMKTGRLSFDPSQRSSFTW